MAGNLHYLRMMFWKKKKAPKKPTRAEIMAELKENSRKATKAIGEDTLAKVRAQIEKDENNEFHKALKKIKAMDQDRIADNIRAIYREED